MSVTNHLTRLFSEQYISNFIVDFAIGHLDVDTPLFLLNTECSICQEDKADMCIFYRVNCCQQLYCKSCLFRTCQISSVCAYCRSDLTKKHTV